MLHTGDKKATLPQGGDSNSCQVMIVDDSAVIRSAMRRILESSDGITVAATASNGEQALFALKKYPLDIIILDIEMPVMDGLTALPKLLAINPTVKIIVASTLTLRNAEISFKALALGATDYIPKPTSLKEMGEAADFKRSLIQKVKSLTPHDKRQHFTQGPTLSPSFPTAGGGISPGVPAKTFPLRAPSSKPPAVLAIGTSTGGPQALVEVFKSLRRKPPSKPIFVIQHMPPKFTTVLAEHLTQAYGRKVVEAHDGLEAVAGGVYVAPGDYHMTIQRRGTSIQIHLDQRPKENFCRPAVDPLFRSVAKVYGHNTLGLILTGMGADGLKGSQSIVDSGGTVLAQDEASSVVWGMPGAVSEAGLASKILPLDKVGDVILEMIG